MKFINHFTIALAILVLNACSTSDNLSPENSETANLEIKVSEDYYPSIYIEELHYMHLVSEYGLDHPLVPVYQDLFEEFAGGIKPGSGCPAPKPCDSNPTGNCKIDVFELRENFTSLLELNDLHIDFFNYDGEHVNELASVYKLKCPSPKSLIYDLAEPLEGSGYYKISFSSELTEGEMIEFELPFQQL